jgi:polar amino acid transport system substrate-binding protein
MSNPRHLPRRPASRFVWAVCLSAVLLAACGTSTTALSRTAPAASVMPAGAQIVHPAPSSSTDDSCGDPTASIAPPAVQPSPGDMPTGSFMAKILAQGYFTAGVDQNKYLWGYQDPATNTYSGFDIDMLEQISQAIFGSPGHIHFKAIPTADRAQAVASGEVDIVAQTMTITCDRDKLVDFSSVYFDAGQEILVPSNSSITGPADLAGKRVCAAAGSTSLNQLAGLRLKPAPQLWAVPADTDCLVMLQQGDVDAISTDNVILQGLAAQDPNTKIIGPAFSSEPYGMAISKTHPEFTSFVNGVLAQERSDGTWASIYNHWLLPYTGGTTPTPPVATYRAGT